LLLEHYSAIVSASWSNKATVHTW